MTLEIGNVAETVSVTAEVAALQTDRSDTGRKDRVGGRQRISRSARIATFRAF